MIYIKLSDKELLHVKGGFEKSIGLTVIIGGLIAFISGVLDGYINPKKCNNL